MPNLPRPVPSLPPSERDRPLALFFTASAERERWRGDHRREFAERVSEHLRQHPGIAVVESAELADMVVDVTRLWPDVLNFSYDAILDFSFPQARDQKATSFFRSGEHTPWYCVGFSRETAARNLAASMLPYLAADYAAIVGAGWPRYRMKRPASYPS